MNISGKSKVYALIGQPVDHSISPLIQNTISEILKIDSVYVCFDVKPEDLDICVKGLISLGVTGFNVTMPHKENVIKYMDCLSETAAYIKAANTVHVKSGIVKGYNTDCEGFIKSVKMCSSSGMEDNTVLMLGAGGAAKAVAVACLSDNCRKLYIHNRTMQRALDLKNSLSDFNDRIEIIKDVSDAVYVSDVIINTTSVGMHPHTDSSPVPDNTPFKRDQRVFDIIYNPPETKFLRQAKQAGALVYNGYNMLFWQAVIAYEIWNDITIKEDELSLIKRKLNIL